MIVQKNTLDSETRERIYGIIKNTAGICIRELQRETGFAIGQLTYHLSILLKSNLINEESDNRFRRFYVKDIPEDERKLLFLLRHNTIRKIIILLLEKEKIMNKEISKSLLLSPATISWYIHNLKEHKLVKEDKNDLYLLNNREEITMMMRKYRYSLENISNKRFFESLK